MPPARGNNIIGSYLLLSRSRAHCARQKAEKCGLRLEMRPAAFIIERAKARVRAFAGDAHSTMLGDRLAFSSTPPPRRDENRQRFYFSPARRGTIFPAGHREARGVAAGSI